MRASQLVLLRHRDLLMVFIFAISTALVHNPLGLERLPIQWIVAIVVDSRGDTMQLQANAC